MSTGETMIEAAIDKHAAGALALSGEAGGMSFGQMAEAMEFAKLMAIAHVAVPAHLRKNPGACLAVTIQAVEWRMSPFAVANKTYVVNDRLAFESQLVHAVIEQRAPLIGRLRHSFAGTGDARTCTVWAHVQGESEPLSYTSPEIGKITPKNSPLWKTKPDLQLYYNASRDWARMYFPDVIMGVYAVDELEPTVVQAAVVSKPRTTADLVAREKPRDPWADYTAAIDAAASEDAARDIFERACHTSGPLKPDRHDEAALYMRARIDQMKGAVST